MEQKAIQVLNLNKVLHLEMAMVHSTPKVCFVRMTMWNLENQPQLLTTLGKDITETRAGGGQTIMGAGTHGPGEDGINQSHPSLRARRRASMMCQ